MAAFLGNEATITAMGACFQWGAAKVHAQDMIGEKNFSINIAGPMYFWDILTPLTLIIGLVMT